MGVPRGKRASPMAGKVFVVMDSYVRRGMLRFAVYFALLAVIIPLPLSSQENEALKPLKKVIPVYPEVLKHAGISGTVRVRVLIGPDGIVKDVEARGGGAVFIDAVAKAVKQWRYLPTGEHQRVSEVTVSFECCNTVTTIP
jgi:TonB family protein